MHKKASGIPDKTSGGGFRSEDEAVNVLALEMQEIVKAAAQPYEADDSKKAKIRRAWENLGKPPFWRVRDAWYGYAGCWSGVAVDDFRARDAARRAELEKREEAGRAKARELGHLFRTIAANLRETDPDFHRDQIAQLEHAARMLGGACRTVAEGD